MKKLLIVVFAMLLILTACTAETTAPEETVGPPTEESLEAAPTETVEPTNTAESTATNEPEPTETTEPEPTNTAEPEPEVTDAPPQPEAPSGYEGTIPEDFELPDGAVVVYAQTGGFAGINNSWVFYEDGRVMLNGAELNKFAPERIQKLVDDLAAKNFFETAHNTKPGEFCCDFFDYVLAVQTASRQNYVSFSDGNLELPTNLLEINSIMREITNEAQLQ